MSAQEVISRAFESLRIQISENSEEKKVLLEFDSLISRLQSMMRSQIIIALEKQKQCDEEKVMLESEKSKYQAFYDETFTKIKNDFELEKINLEKIYEEKVKNIQNEAEFKIKNKELKFTQLSEKYEKLESNFQMLERDKSTLQKQYTESMRSYEIADERLMELPEKVKELEEKLRNFEAIKEKNSALEKAVAIFQLKLEALVKEEALKREYFEKDLKREFEVEKRELLKKDPHLSL